jgi:hypothetical protein
LSGNATHRMNDVWLYKESLNQWGRWRRLSDAPYSPRSDIVAYSFPETSLQGRPTVLTYFIGGQTDDACGLQELGVCSNEVWAAWLNTNETQEFDELELRWLSQGDTPHAVLPFAARCDAAVVTRPDPYPYREQPTLLAIIGGQLSYSDSTCSSPPLFSNQVYYSPMNVTSSSWRK